MDKPHTGLDDCLNMLLSCFRARISGLEVVGGREDAAVAVVDVEGEEVALSHHHDVLRVGEPPGMNSMNNICGVLSSYVAFTIETRYGVTMMCMT